MKIAEFRDICEMCDLKEGFVRAQNYLVHIQEYGDEAGYDYSIFDAGNGLPLDGGLITNEEYSIADVLTELYPEIRTGQCFDILPMELYEAIISGEYTDWAAKADNAERG